MNKEIRRYTIWSCLIIIIATYPIAIKNANSMIVDYQNSMREVDNYFTNKAQAKEMEHVEEIKVEEPTYTSTVDKTEPEAKIDEPETDKEVIKDKIRKAFGENGENMIKLFTCESGLNPKTAGDLSLSFEHEGEILGSSHGIAQIRTGGNDNGILWNRAKANGMTVKEFIKKLEDPDYNINYAKGIFESRGYSGWYNCAIRTNLIK